MTNESEERPPERHESDEALREAQTGKGYGEDEGEREPAAGNESGEDPSGETR